MGTVRLVLGDQLSETLSALDDGDPESDVIVMAEVRDEATYVKHHKKKIAFLFAAMRHHAKALEETGWTVQYFKITDDDGPASIEEACKRVIESSGFDRLIITKPGEFRLLSQMQSWSETLNVSVELREDTRFIASLDDFADWAKGRKQLRMEYFYRDMRKSTGILVNSDAEPEGGEWNYDQANRKSLPKSKLTPERFLPEPDATTRAAIDDVEACFSDHFGDLDPFFFATTKNGAEDCFDHFINEILPGFGDYQDAMAKDEPWMWHSLISMYLNCGLLDPLNVCRRAEPSYENGKAPINAVEGFIRQVLGWREYVRGLYWLKMPDYKDTNALDADRPLPEFYWTGETDMVCMAQAIGQTKKYAYAHHIQRLMVTGNFALLAGISPEEINDWYLSVYADAYEWVELPNTHGMAIYADGGVMASKPYAASGSYINKMSDYCSGCSYDVKQKMGEGACPFNLLYWDFIARNEGKLRSNPRMGLIYGNLDKRDPDDIAQIREEAASFLNELN